MHVRTPALSTTTTDITTDINEQWRAHVVAARCGVAQHNTPVATSWELACPQSAAYKRPRLDNVLSP
jgi:hypothetical protein